MSREETPPTVAPEVQDGSNDETALQRERDANNANELTSAEFEARLKADPDVQKSAKMYMYGRVERRPWDGIQFFAKSLVTLAASSINVLRKSAEAGKTSNLDCRLAASEMTGASEASGQNSLQESEYALSVLSAMRREPFSGTFDRSFPLAEHANVRVRTPRVVRGAPTTMYDPPKIPVRQTSTSLIRRAFHKRTPAEKKRRVVNVEVVPSDD